MIKINLVPQEILDRELQKQRALQLSVMGTVAATFLVVFSLGHYFKGVRLKKELEVKQKKLDNLQKTLAEVEELERTAQLVRARLNVMQGLLAGRPLYPRFMEELVRIIPPGVWLTNLSTSNNGSGLTVSISAKSLRSEDVARWLRTFASSQSFSEAVLGPISIDPNDKTSSFTISTKYTPTEVKR